MNVRLWLRVMFGFAIGILAGYGHYEWGGFWDSGLFRIVLGAIAILAPMLDRRENENQRLKQRHEQQLERVEQQLRK